MKNETLKEFIRIYLRELFENNHLIFTKEHIETEIENPERVYITLPEMVFDALNQVYNIEVNELYELIPNFDNFVYETALEIIKN